MYTYESPTSRSLNDLVQDDEQMVLYIAEIEFLGILRSHLAFRGQQIHVSKLLQSTEEII